MHASASSPLPATCGLGIASVSAAAYEIPAAVVGSDIAPRSMAVLLALVALSLLLVHVAAITVHPDLGDLIRYNNVTSDSRDGRLLCRNIRTKYSTHGNTSRCCVVHGLQGVRCLPSFLIAGVQKAGTTALAAFLAHQSQHLSLAPKKEVHFFDKMGAYKKGVPHYLSAFHRWEYAAVNRYYPPLYGESSPFYVASPFACRRIAKTLPGAKLVVLLREPAARAYSEWQMKKRRVEQQDEFIALALRHQQRLQSCLLRHGSAQGFDWRAVRQCVPLELSSHYHFDKLVIGVNKLISAGDDAMLTCFLASPLGNSSSLNSSSLQPVSFLAEPCMGKYARERLPTLKQAFLDDIESFRSCAGALLDAGVPGAVKNLSKAVGKCLKVTLGISRHYVYRSLYVAQLYNCFKSVPRSDVLVLPSERLLHQPRETLSDILAFIGVPADHAQRVLQGASTSYSTSTSTNNSSSYTSNSNSNGTGTIATDATLITGELVQRYFPKFEQSTGWRLRSEYEPMPSELRGALQAFFEPHNRQLFDLLRTQPYPEWAA